MNIVHEGSISRIATPYTAAGDNYGNVFVISHGVEHTGHVFYARHLFAPRGLRSCCSENSCILVYSERIVVAKAVQLVIDHQSLVTIKNQISMPDLIDMMRLAIENDERVAMS